MMPVIRLPDSTYTRLQRHAVPFTDTPAAVIDRLIDFFEAAEPRRDRGEPVPSPTTYPLTATEYDSDDPPSLTHSEVLEATFAGEVTTEWNQLYRCAVAAVVRQAGGLDAVPKDIRPGVTATRRTERGYHYYPELELSIRNCDAKAAWRNVFRLARHLKVPFHVRFEWPDDLKVDSRLRGTVGVLNWVPPES